MTAPAPPRPAVPMDPRIRARRIEVLRSEGRRRLRILAVASAALAAIGAGVGATRSPLLDVDAIVVVGNEHTDYGELVAAGGIHRGMQMLDVDEATVASELGDLPWVRSAVVEKRWPGTIRIGVTERMAAAAITAGPGQWALVDDRGRVLEQVSELPAGLVSVTGAVHSGPAGSSLRGRLADAVDVATVLPDDVRALLPEVRVAGAELELAGPAGPVVRFGSAVDTEAKVQALRALIAEVDLRRVRTIDVRVPSAPVLTRG